MHVFVLNQARECEMMGEALRNERNILLSFFLIHYSKIFIGDLFFWASLDWVQSFLLSFSLCYNGFYLLCQNYGRLVRQAKILQRAKQSSVWSFLWFHFKYYSSFSFNFLYGRNTLAELFSFFFLEFQKLRTWVVRFTSRKMLLHC